MARILAIDSGLTVTKAVVFDLEGRQLGVARRNVAQRMAAPHHVERDMPDLWQQTCAAIREVLSASGTAPGDVIVVAATAHGDGVYLLDHAANRSGLASCPWTAGPGHRSPVGRPTEPRRAACR